MSLATNIQSAFTRVGTEFKTVYSRLGVLTSLTTTNKTNLVAAINEVNAKPTATGGPAINDAAASTTSVYSSTKTEARLTEVAAATKSELLGGAGAAYDTLKELQDLITSDTSADASFVTATNTALGNRLRFDAAQTLTAPQKVQGNANLGSLSLVDAGDPNADFVATFVTALA